MELVRILDTMGYSESVVVLLTAITTLSPGNTMKLKRSTALLLSIIPLTVLAFACAQDPAPEPEVAPAPFPPLTEEEAAELIHDVIVYQAEDGSFLSKEVPITRGARRAQELARFHRQETPAGDLGQVSSAINKDISCQSTSFWGYDQPNRQGTRICLVESSQSGSIDLEAFCHFYCARCTPQCQSTWDQRIKSYYAGRKQGMLIGYALPYHISGNTGTLDTFWRSFKPYEIKDSLDYAPTKIELSCPPDQPPPGSAGNATAPTPTSCPG